MLLAGDIGGTKTVLALFDAEAAVPTLHRRAAFPSRAFKTFDAVLERFLEPFRGIVLSAACFGVAGPVMAAQVRTTNLPWALDAQALAARLGLRQVSLLNDMQAMAYGMLHLPPHEFHVVSPGAPPAEPANIAVIAAGTGLGEAMLVRIGTRYHPLATEGGHADFAPRNAMEFGLLGYLSEQHGGHVSWERVLSGSGLVALYRYLRQRTVAEPGWLAARLQHAPDPAAVVTAVGLDRSDPVCVETLELFTSLYGAEAGNLALKTLALGGVLVGGGIAPRLLPVLRGGHFLQALTDKGRYADLLRRVPVKVALNPDAPLLGAAHYALHAVELP